MKAINLTKSLKHYSSGWIALDKKTKKVVAHAPTFALLSKQIKTKDKVFVMPASKNYFGFVT